MRAERLYREVRRAFKDFVVPEFRAAREAAGAPPPLASSNDRIESVTLTRIGRAAPIGSMAIYDQIKQAIQDLIAPELHSLSAQIQRVDQKIDSLRTELIAEIRRVDARIDGLDRELRSAIEIRERLAALEARRPA